MGCNLAEARVSFPGGTVEFDVYNGFIFSVLLVVSKSQNKRFRVAENIVFKIVVDDECDCPYFCFV